MSPDNSSTPLVLQAESLAKSFKTPRGPLDVLTNVTLSVSAGECVSIRGESGSGKTTLLQILGGLDRASSGELSWNGEQVSGRSNAFLATRRARWLGYVFQSYHLVPELSALENVILAARIAGQSTKVTTPKARELLARVGLEHRIQHLPSQLSGGECQRVALARALINKPRLILADEPTGNLDERTGEDIMALLLNLAKSEGVALVLVTHNSDFARRAERQLFLRRGELCSALETGES
ncbi:MAG: ABC transporter ATP-binding protein [Puniceicoccales bacterium]|jgi:predicted ABC-type transport system involved in lysophospholipase L1 biosynthesis ATPase subunit|nr:ABC transporter ATP-binding protein [Puniceicoccales bacterium]